MRGSKLSRKPYFLSDIKYSLPFVTSGLVSLISFKVSEQISGFINEKRMCLFLLFSRVVNRAAVIYGLTLVFYRFESI